jgi:hypothetical protein
LKNLYAGNSIGAIEYCRHPKNNLWRNSLKSEI